MLAAAVIAALAARVLYVSLPDWTPLIQALIVLPPFGVLYFLLAWLFGIEDAAPGRVLRVLRR
jgi:hypothetical protein